MTFGDINDEDHLNITKNLMPGKLQITIDLSYFSEFLKFSTNLLEIPVCYRGWECNNNLQDLSYM